MVMADRGRTTTFKFLVMGLVGPSLDDIRKDVLNRNYTSVSKSQVSRKEKKRERERERERERRREYSNHLSGDPPPHNSRFRPVKRCGTCMKSAICTGKGRERERWRERKKGRERKR